MASNAKILGDHAYAAGHWEAAFQQYSFWLKTQPCDVVALCNRAAAALKACNLAVALRDCKQLQHLLHVRALRRKASQKVVHLPEDDMEDGARKLGFVTTHIVSAQDGGYTHNEASTAAAAADAWDPAWAFRRAQDAARSQSNAATLTWTQDLLRQLLPKERVLLLKALFRQACALEAMQQPESAIDVLHRAMQMFPTTPVLRDKTFHLLYNALPSSHLAAIWTTVIQDAEAAQKLLTARDGKLLKPVMPHSARLTGPQMQQHLLQLFDGKEHEQLLVNVQEEAAWLLCLMWDGKDSTRARSATALMRSLTYLRAGNVAQAIKDCQVAIAYGPQVNNQSVWPLALLVHARVDALKDSLQEAVLHVQQAIEAVQQCSHVDSTEGEAGGSPKAGAIVAQPIGSASAAASSSYSSAEAGARKACAQAAALLAAKCSAHVASWEEWVQRVVPKLPEAARLAVQEAGAAGLLHVRRQHMEQELPPYLRAREPLYHYKQWMRSRIQEQVPGKQLPEAVVDKLLDMDAAELDLLLQYKGAVADQVARLEGVYAEGGEAALHDLPALELSWEDVKQLTGPDVIGLGTEGQVTRASAVPMLPNSSGQQVVEGPAAPIHLEGPPAFNQLEGPAATNLLIPPTAVSP